MKYLFVSNYYPPYGRGGYEQWCAEIAQRFVDRGYDVQVLTSRVPADERASVNDVGGQIAVHRKLFLEAKGGLWQTGIDFFFRRGLQLEANLGLVRSLVGSFQPDLIVVWGMWNVPRAVAAEFELLMPGRVFYYLSDYWPILPTAYRQYWETQSGRSVTRLPKRLIGKLALALLDQEDTSHLLWEHSVCVSYDLRERLAAYIGQLGNARVLYGGIEIVAFLQQRRPASPLEEGKLHVLYAGRLAVEKGVHTVIEAMHLLQGEGELEREIVVDIAGSGDEGYKAMLEAMIADFSLEHKVRLLGKIPYGNMPSLYAGYDALVFPSIWPEPFGRSLVEAMAAGLVAVGTGTGGSREILVADETGLVFPPEDAVALARQLKRLCDEPALSVRLRDTSIKRVQERFSLGRMADEIESYLLGLSSGVVSSSAEHTRQPMHR